MKKILLSCMLLIAGTLSAQVINFDDANFKYKLVTTGQNIGNWYAKDSAGNYLTVDANADGEIDQAEAQAVYELYLFHGGWGSPIQSLGGIEYFTNLQSLDVWSNNLSSLDVSGCTNLITLNCRANNISSLNVDGLSQLQYLQFEFNPITTFAPTGLTSLTTLQAGNCQLSSLDLSLFPALTSLECNNNQLTALDATAAPLLTSLGCPGNQISSLNISGLPLQYLNCSGNQISSLDISGLPLLHLGCSGNPLPNLDLSGFTGLISLDCVNIGISQLDLTGFTSLSTLNCSGNPITYLNTADLGALHHLSISNTLITELDLSHSPNIPYFGAGDNPLLTSINLHNGTSILYPGECYLGNNPNLQYICVDEGEEEEMMLQYFEWNMQPPVYMSTDCIFVPDQVYNEISGQVTYDFDGDGCDQDDVAAAFTKVVISDGTTDYIRFTNEQGEYFRYAAPGDYTITPELDTDLFIATPLEGSVNFAGFEGEEYIQDFCLTANGIQSDAAVIIVPYTGAMPGFESLYRIIISNNGNQILSGELTFAFDDAVLDYVYSYPAADTVGAGTLTWNYTGLLPFATRQIIVNLHVNAPTDTPAVNIDDILNFTASVTTTGADETPADNSFDLAQVVTGSYDPNNIICLEGETEDVEAIGDYLHYVINFENTGTDAATTVTITNQIDTAKFNIGSLEIISSSHNLSATLIGNNLEFRFDEIGLEASERGNVVFRIKSKATLQEGDAVMNQASIVFDYNYALETNVATTVYEAVTGIDPVSSGLNIALYPNPVLDIVTISAVDSIKGVELYDINGRLLKTSMVNEQEASLDLSGYTQGVYLVKIITEKGSVTERVIKQ